MKRQKIEARAILEVIGSPKDFVEETLGKVEEKLKETDSIKVLRCEKHNAVQMKNKFWSAFMEAEIEVENVKKLIGFCYDYMPSTLEIIEPLGFEIDAEEFGSALNDLLARLHQYSKVIKNMQAEIILAKKKLGEIK
ncbi:hypothetical protein HZB88_04640 [archaeon]|nr:hypothetical protein [archaeon]